MTTAVHPPFSPPPGKTSPLELHAQRLFAAGQRMFVQSEWQAAARLFELVLKVNPQHVLARRYLGEALLEMGQVKSALQHLHRVYQEDPEKGREAFRRALQALSVQSAHEAGEADVLESPSLPEAASHTHDDAPPDDGSGAEQTASQGARPISVDNAASLREETLLGRGRIVAFTYLSDGDVLAVGTAVGVYLYDAHSLALQRFLPTQAWVWHLASSPDGNTLAIGLENGRVLLWAYATDQPPVSLAAHDAAVRALAFSPDGALLASGSMNGLVRIWQVQRQTLLRSMRSNKGEIRALTFSADGTLLALASESRHVQVRRVSDGALLYTLHGHRQAVRSVAFTHDDRLIAASGEDGRINLWKVGEEYPARTIKDFMGIVNRIVFSPDDRLLASASWDGIVRLWRPGEGSIWKRLDEQQAPIADCAFSPDGNMLTTLTVNEEVLRVWNVYNGELLKSLSHLNALLAVAVSPRQDYLAAGTRDGRVLLWMWPPQSGEPDVTLAGHQAAVRCVAFAPTQEYLASGGDDAYVMLWKLSHSAARRLNLPRDSGAVNSLQFTADGNWLFAATQGGRIYCWDARDLWETAMLPIVPKVWAQFACSVEALVSAGTRSLLLGGTDSGRAYVWQVESNILLHELRQEMRALRSAAISSDGKHIALGSTEGRVHIWNIETGQRVRILEAPQGPIRSLAFSPDGRVLASVSGDGGLCLWQWENGVLLSTLTGHMGKVWQVVFSPDGKHLLSAGDDGTLRIWAPLV